MRLIVLRYLAGVYGTERSSKQDSNVANEGKIRSARMRVKKMRMQMGRVVGGTGIEPVTSTV
jgi:hypothetical protein